MIYLPLLHISINRPMHGQNYLLALMIWKPNIISKNNERVEKGIGIEIEIEIPVFPRAFCRHLFKVASGNIKTDKAFTAARTAKYIDVIEIIFN